MPNPNRHRTIQDFRGAFKQNSIAKANKFSISIGIDGPYTYLVDSITLPSKSLTVYTYSLFGPIIQYPYRETYNDNVAFTFNEVNTKQGTTMYSYLTEWMDSMTTMGSVFPDSVDTSSAQVKIQQLNDKGHVNQEWTLFGAYPISVVPVNMGQGMMNEPLKCQVMMKYYKYKLEVY